jgi:hypothetical protein
MRGRPGEGGRRRGWSQVALSALAAGVLAPSLCAANGTKAGIVTTLEGTVTASRVAQPRPISLKFRDDVYLQDTIVTAESSLARFLLGGKAIVTLRERSTLTITELPGRSTVDLPSGKAGFAFARERMRAGEQIDIRTPNAVVAVRGTVIVVETMALGGASGPTLTRVYLLKGRVDVAQRDPATGAVIGGPIALTAPQAVTLVDGAAPRTTAISPDQFPAITAGLRPSGMQLREPPAKEALRARSVEDVYDVLGRSATSLSTLPPGETCESPSARSVRDVQCANPAVAPLIPRVDGGRAQAVSTPTTTTPLVEQLRPDPPPPSSPPPGSSVPVQPLPLPPPGVPIPNLPPPSLSAEPTLQ